MIVQLRRMPTQLSPSCRLIGPLALQWFDVDHGLHFLIVCRLDRLIRNEDDSRVDFFYRNSSWM